jgi:hypothetical protein
MQAFVFGGVARYHAFVSDRITYSTMSDARLKIKHSIAGKNEFGKD